MTEKATNGIRKEKEMFPLRIQCIELAPDQYIGVFNAKTIFIAEKRKSHQLTLRRFAEQIDISAHTLQT